MASMINPWSLLHINDNLYIISCILLGTIYKLIAFSFFPINTFEMLMYIIH